MRDTHLIMGMPITIEVVGASAPTPLKAAFAYFRDVDARFSPFRPDSEVSRFNRGELAERNISGELREILLLAEITRQETNGYFDIRRPDGLHDPSGLVKGWAIRNAARLLNGGGYADYFIEAGGDIQCAGRNPNGEPWRIGIRNPFAERETVKAIQPGNAGVATSGSYVRGQHIYDPRNGEALAEIVSLTVVADDIYDADRFATAAFAMGHKGISFVESISGLEGYAIDRQGIATMTSGFKQMVVTC
ncbi:MAG TPA: FAD:protein FMN transferase [Devosiaceae bacterium]|nr:FAD:protein FMN transferase [Devosiaceae bacterium]